MDARAGYPQTAGGLPRADLSVGMGSKGIRFKRVQKIPEKFEGYGFADSSAASLTEPAASGSPRREPWQRCYELAYHSLPLPRASIGGRIGLKRVGLFERSEFRHAPSLTSTRRNKRGTGAFFWLLFLTAS